MALITHFSPWEWGCFMKKVWLGIGVVLVVVCLGGVFYFLSNLNAIVAKVMEEQGSEVVATEVSVSGVNISLRDGRGTISGLSVGSPEGFEARQAFTLAEITVDIDLESVREDPLVIDEIRVRAPVVNAEFLASGASNISELQKNLQQYAASVGGGSDGGGQNSDEMKRIRIKRFVFEKGRIEVDAVALGLAKQSLDLPAISLDDIGGADGARPDEIAQAVLGALSRKATAEIARAGVENKVRGLVTDKVDEGVKGLLDKFGK